MHEPHLRTVPMLSIARRTQLDGACSAHSSGANPRRIVFSQLARGSTNGSKAGGAEYLLQF
ncbi:MAG: hypothetical protein AAFX05_05925, partial [Planctomycetota bacterium]